MDCCDLISIVTSLYQYKRYIAELCRSVQRQSYKNWEHIIVDDGSTDNPLEALRPFLASDSRFVYVPLGTNKGYSVAKNVGIKKSRGEYIVMIDADDKLTINSLEIRHRELSANPDKLWIHGEVHVLQANGNLSDQSRQWKRNFRQRLIREGMNLDKQYHHRLIHAQSVMVRRQLHEKYGLYDESLRFSSDSEMWRRVIRVGDRPLHIDDYVAI